MGVHFFEERVNALELLGSPGTIRLDPLRSLWLDPSYSSEAWTNTLTQSVGRIPWLLSCAESGARSTSKTDERSKGKQQEQKKVKLPKKNKRNKIREAKERNCAYTRSECTEKNVRKKWRVCFYFTVLTIFTILTFQQNWILTEMWYLKLELIMQGAVELLFRHDFRLWSF